MPVLRGAYGKNGHSIGTKNFQEPYRSDQGRRIVLDTRMPQLLETYTEPPSDLAPVRIPFGLSMRRRRAAKLPTHEEDVDATGGH